MKPHVDKYIVPYAVPLWKKTSILLNKAWVEAKELAKKTHAKVVASYKKSCPGTLKRLEEMEHAPKSMVDHVKQSCREPERTVNIFLWTLLFISVIVFRSFLWRNLVALALLPFQIVWFFCPLRLVFGKGKQSVDDELSEDETPVARYVTNGVVLCVGELANAFQCTWLTCSPLLSLQITQPRQVGAVKEGPATVKIIFYELLSRCEALVRVGDRLC